MRLRVRSRTSPREPDSSALCALPQQRARAPPARLNVGDGASEARFHRLSKVSSQPHSLRVKGSHLLQARELLDLRLGPSTFDRLAATEHVALGPLLPGVWYDAEPVVRMLQLGARELSTDVETLTCEIARSNAFADLNSIYKVFLRAAQPRRILSFVPQLWRTYVDFATGRVIKNDAGRFVGQCSDVPEELVMWARGCWLGFLPSAVELCGGAVGHARIARSWTEARGLGAFELEIHYS
jgi:hypothetical protein